MSTIDGNIAITPDVVKPESTISFEEIINFGKGRNFNYNKEITTHEIIENQIKKAPDNIAIICNAKQLTYNQLNNKANQLANYLLNNGFKSGSSVAIYLDPSLNTIISVLAILKAGGCYVPLDTSYPPDRLNFMLADSNASVLITSKKLINKLQAKNILIINVDSEAALINKQPKTNLKNLITSVDNAYIIYTSGSTGTPKGVRIHHRAINNHMAWMQDQFKFNPTDNFLFKTPISFDPSVWEIFLPLFIGAKLIIAPHGSHLDPYQLCKLVISHQITILQLVPTLLQQLLKQKNIYFCHSLKHVFSGGETLPTHTKKLFFETLKCKLHNLYGPTEATIDITYHAVRNTRHDLEANLIGKPVYNTQLYVLKSDMSICQVNEPGELYIYSDSLSFGYNNQLSLTNEKFVNNPFLPLDNIKIYKTGDIVKWLPNGLLEYLGRNNDQIKINGVRIEINELISRILTDKSVSNCVIIKKLDAYNHDYLACYVVPKENSAVDINNIKKLLKSFFPNFMLPKAFFIIKELPLTVNGKTDFNKLANIQNTNKSEETLRDKKLPSSDESKLIEIWKRVLQVKSIELQDDFFELGGHSLLALQLLEHINKAFGVLPKVSSIFISPTIASQLKLIKNLKRKKVNKKASNLLDINPIIPLETEGNKTPVFLIHPVGGTVFWYTLLAKFMGSSRPIYGIQDPGIELKSKIFSSIKDMALFYSAVIRKTQPKGPYIIGGASFGATVAIEVCNILQSQGEDIKTIPILDGWGIYPDTLRDDGYFKESMRRQKADLYTQFAQYGLTESKNLLTLQKQRLNLLWKYHLSEINHNIVLFKAKETLPVFEPIEAKFNHWDKFTRKKIKCYRVPGNHETMFQKPNVEILAKLINNHLSKFEDEV